MAQCPVCQHDVPDDFGLIDCPNCSAPLIVQMDGSVQSAAAEVDASVAEVSEPSASPEADDVPPPFVAAAPTHENVEPDDAPEAEPESEPESAPPGQSEEEIAAYFNDSEPVPTSQPPPPISDLSTLANDTQASAQGGSLRYTIVIAGIDTADIRGEFKELISDRRFLWDVDAILKSIKSGHVRLENVTAVKAMLLVQRLRGLPLQIQWEQHVVHQT